MARGHSRQRDLAETLLAPRPAPAELVRRGAERGASRSQGRAVSSSLPPAGLTAGRQMLWLLQRWPITRAGYAIDARTARSLVASLDPTAAVGRSAVKILLDEMVLDGRLVDDAAGESSYRLSTRSLADVDDDEPPFYPQPSADGRCGCTAESRCWMSTLMICGTCGAALSDEQVEALVASIV